MRIESIRAFLKTANEGSINRASEKMQTSHQNLGKIISGMESELGVTLFNRSKGGLSLTAEGKIIYEKFMGIDNLYGEVEKMAQAASEDWQRPVEVLDIAIARNAIPQVLSEAILAVCDAYPNVDLRIREVADSEAIELVLSDENVYANVSLGNDVKNSELRAKGIRVLSERPTELAVFLPLALSDVVKGGKVDASRLADLPLIQYHTDLTTPEGSYGSLLETGFFKPKHVVDNVLIYTNMLRTGRYGTVIPTYKNEGPVLERYMKSGVFGEEPFIAATVTWRNKPIDGRVIWCCKQGQTVSKPINLLLREL